MKKITIALVSALLIFAFAVPSFCEFQALIKNKKLAKEIGLSDEQVKEIKELTINTKKKMIKIRADIELKEIDLKVALDEDKPNEGKAVSLINDIMKKKTEARVLQIKQLISIKKTLTSEQLEKFEEFKRERQAMKEHRHKRGGHNPPEHPKHRMEP
ncbi:hypothetical protein KAX75_10230 [candidate division WOR-3 bacterium]|nr:hypothetical protein [candidate division WOR-3 bacterium]